MTNFDDEFDKAPEASFDDEFESAPDADAAFDAAPELGQASMSGEAESGIGGIAGYLAGKGLVEAAGSDYVKGLSEDLGYRGIGGMTTPDGVKFKRESLKKTLDPDMVNITPRSVGRQVLDEGILGTVGLASPGKQITNQAEMSQAKAMDKTNFLSKIDQPGAIDKQALLAEYQSLVGADKLDPAVPTNRSIISQLDKDASSFDGFQSIIDNEKSKSDLQSRSSYGTDTKESARQLLDKKQAEARRLASESAVQSQLGQQGLDEFRRLKTRSGSAQVAEKIIDRNFSTDGIKPGTIDKASKVAAEFVLEKLPGMGAVALDKINKVANNPVVKKAVPLAGTLLGLTSGNASEAAEQAVGDVPFVGQAYEAIRPEVAGSSMDDREIKAESDASKAYKESSAYADRMSQFTKSTPEQLDQLAMDLETEGSRFAAPVAKAMASDPTKRTAALYGLYQQPAFRELVNKHNKKKSAF